ncbi:MAG TPA: C39 family peptidase [Candidatus Manganitrophaceae bacterium]|nr:C39 family peptidase [Candidatus Manganitrophaceae bacterium]
MSGSSSFIFRGAPRFAGRGLLFSLLFLWASCAPISAVPTSARTLLLDVPFFPQQENLCGPASLASILHYWNEKTPVEEIARAVYLPKLKGSLGIDLARFARDKNFKAEYYNGSLSDLRGHLARGVPVIAFLNLGNRLFPAGHFVAVTGLDERREEVIAHSGTEPNKRIPYKVFIAAWEKTRFWTLRVTPPERRA